MSRLSLPMSASSFGFPPRLGCSAEDINPLTGKTVEIENLFESELVPWLRLDDYRHRVAEYRLPEPDSELTWGQPS